MHAKHGCRGLLGRGCWHEVVPCKVTLPSVKRSWCDEGLVCGECEALGRGGCRCAENLQVMWRLKVLL